MVILIFHDDVSFSLHLGEPNSVTSTASQVPIAANAGFFSEPASLLGNVFTSSAFAKTELTIMDTQTGAALIERFQSVANAEHTKFGIDAGVLLATAIAAGVVESPSQVNDTNFTTNYFGTALQGTYPTAWSSWRAMSLATLASTDIEQPTRDDFVRAAAAQFEDQEAAQKRIYEALRFYQL